MNDLSNNLIQYGAIGVCLAVAYWFILRMMKSHEKERNEWRETTERQFEKMNESAATTNSILTEVKTMINSRK